jgi:ankyrin repeat domain-containing protein 50
MLMVVGRTAPRHQEIVYLYPQSKRLQDHLSEYFIVLVRLCHQQVLMAKKSGFSQFISFPSEQDLKPFETDFNHWSSAIKEEVTILMARGINEIKGHTSGMREALGLIKVTAAERSRKEAFVKLLDRCSTYDHQMEWKRLLKLGRSTVFEASQQYKDWVSQTSPSTLACVGKLGCGKSVTMANIVQDVFSQRAKDKHLVAYFFCQHSNVESRQARTILGSIARQILHSTQPLLSCP